MEWISVKDKLPELSGHYLGYDPKGFGVSEFEYVAKAKKWCWVGDSPDKDCENWSKNKVTHWMLLPDEPKEINNGSYIK